MLTDCSGEGNFGREGSGFASIGNSRLTSLSRYVQVREIATDFFDGDDSGNHVGLRWQSSALLALQEATEAYILSLSNPLSKAHADRYSSEQVSRASL